MISPTGRLILPTFMNHGASRGSGSFHSVSLDFSALEKRLFSECLPERFAFVQKMIDCAPVCPQREHASCLLDRAEELAGDGKVFRAFGLTSKASLFAMKALAKC